MILKNLTMGVLLGTGISLMVACNDASDEPARESDANISISMTDAPGDYEHVIIAVEEMSIRTGGQWVNIPLSQVDTFDILNYANGNQVFLAQGPVMADSTDEIRFVLADPSILILEDGSVHDLKVPGGSTSGLKVKLDTTTVTQSGMNYHIVLDFDVDKSIVKRGNGSYHFKPVIRGYWDEGLGAADGLAISSGYQVSVAAILGPDTLGGTIADSTGYYYVGGLPAGSYDFYYSSSNGQDSLVSGVGIMQNVTTPIDTVML